MNLLKFSLLCYVFIAPLSNMNETATAIDREASFEEFLDVFPNVELPFKIEFSDVRGYLKEQQEENLNKTDVKSKQKGAKMYRRSRMSNEQLIMAQFIGELERASFSRLGPIPHSPVGKMAINENQMAVIYVRETIYPDYYMVVFSKEGKELAKTEIAGFGRKYSKVCTIDADYNIEVKLYDNLWLKDVKKKGLNDNEIIGYDLAKTTLVEIDEKGKINSTIEIQSTDRASIY